MCGFCIYVCVCVGVCACASVCAGVRIVPFLHPHDPFGCDPEPANSNQKLNKRGLWDPIKSSLMRGLGGPKHGRKPESVKSRNSGTETRSSRFERFEQGYPYVSFSFSLCSLF